MAKVLLIHLSGFHLVPKFELTLLAKPSTTGFCVFFGGRIQAVLLECRCVPMVQVEHWVFCGSTFLTRFRCGSGYTSMELESETVIFETAGLR